MGEGAFLEKGQDSCGGLAPPPCGRLRALGSPAGWCLVACPLGTAPPRAWSFALPGRLETCCGHAVCGGGLGPWAPRTEQGGSSGRSSPCAVLGEIGRSRARSQLEVASRVCARAVRWAGTTGRVGPPGAAGSGLSLARGGCGGCLQLGQEGWPAAPRCTDVCARPGETRGVSGGPASVNQQVLLQWS